jgi:hypothetical protein
MAIGADPVRAEPNAFLARRGYDGGGRVASVSNRRKGFRDLR